MLYHYQPDFIGHIYGPNSPEMGEMIRSLDLEVGHLYQKLMSLPIANNINLVIVSDHGMRSISRDRVIYLDKFLDQKMNHMILEGHMDILIQISR